MEENKTRYVWGLLRLTMGLVFLWAFIDKLFGLGFATTPEKSWFAGASPTTQFLLGVPNGPFASFYHAIAGVPVVDWLFMLGLLSVGLTLTLGIGVKLGSSTGIVMLFLMYTAVGMPPVSHPFIDDHFVFILIMVGLILSDSGNYLGLGKQWSSTNLVQRYKILK